MDNNQQNTTRQRHSIKPTSQHHHHNYHASSSPYPSSTVSTSTNTSRWQQLVVGAGSAAGTMSAVISEESMKCLKYCLSWLTYAIQHIEQQMNILRNFLVSLATSKQQQRQRERETSVATSNSRNSSGNNSSNSVLSGVKKDIVETLRKVVDVITKYAGVSLPAHARQAVRGFILNLPGRWAMVNDIRSTTQSPIGSPRLPPPTNSPSTRSSRSSSFSSSMSIDTPYHMNDFNSGTTEYKQEEAAIRLLTFGQESVDMLNSVSHVFSDTVDRAELWIDRLKMVPGINIGGGNNKEPEQQPMNGVEVQQTEQEERIQLPPIRTLINQQEDDRHCTFQPPFNNH